MSKIKKIKESEIKSWARYESYPVLVEFCGYIGFTQLSYGKQPPEVCINVFVQNQKGQTVSNRGNCYIFRVKVWHLLNLVFQMSNSMQNKVQF